MKIAEQIKRRYRVKALRTEPSRVVDELVVKFRISPREYFEWWSRQGELIPPWVMHWYQLGDKTIVYLKGDLLKRLVGDAVEKAGSKTLLCKEIRELREPFDRGKIYRILNGTYRGITVSKLRTLLNYLDTSHDSINSLIEAIGRQRTTRNVNLPIDFNSESGGKLLAAALSDGSITRQHTMKIFYYVNENREMLDTIVKCVHGTIGDAHYWRGKDRVQFYSSVVANALVKAGAVVGRKTMMEPQLPYVISRGEIDTSKGYFRQVFADEGTIEEYRVSYSRAVNITKFLQPRHISELERQDWKKRIMPHERGKIEEILYSKSLEEGISEDLKVVIWSHPPRLMVGEVEALNKKFGIKAKMSPRSLYRSRYGYAVCWRTEIGGETTSESLPRK